MGWTEVDTVAHCGGDMGGDFIWTLTSVEIASGWTELRAVWNRGQQASFEGLESIWESQPFDLLGVDSDNGGEFLNFHLYHWLKKHGIHQTRSRPYYKNDQAYVEQKNHTHVRQFLVYERLEHRELLGDVNHLLKLWSQWRNLFCVTMKQESKRREGSRQIRRHEKKGRSPARRLIDSGDLRPEERRKLESELSTLNPFAMRAEIRRLEDCLWMRREELYQGEEGQANQPKETKSLRCPNYEATLPVVQDSFGVRFSEATGLHWGAEALPRRSTEWSPFGDAGLNGQRAAGSRGPLCGQEAPRSQGGGSAPRKHGRFTLRQQRRRPGPG